MDLQETACRRQPAGFHKAGPCQLGLVAIIHRDARVDKLQSLRDESSNGTAGRAVCDSLSSVNHSCQPIQMTDKRSSDPS